MTRQEITALIVTGLLLVSTFAISVLWVPQRSEAEPEPLRTHIRGIIQLDRSSNSGALLVGYNYYLFESYAEHNGQSVEIGAARKNSSYIDSLKAGRVDMVAVSWHDSLSIDSVLVSRPVDSLSVWLMRADDTRDMEDFDSWLAEWELSEEHEKVRSSFLERYDVFRSRQREVLSPYDSLIRANADSIDVDWRLLAAIIYKESRFHIEAKSHRGASGLMQMMPVPDCSAISFIATAGWRPTRTNATSSHSPHTMPEWAGSMTSCGLPTSGRRIRDTGRMSSRCFRR